MIDYTDQLTPSLRRMLAVLAKDGPLDVKTLAQRAHVAQGSVGGFARALYLGKQIHIAECRPRSASGGRPTFIYAHGPGEDAPLLKAIGRKRERMPVAVVPDDLLEVPEIPPLDFITAVLMRRSVCEVRA